MKTFALVGAALALGFACTACKGESRSAESGGETSDAPRTAFSGEAALRYAGAQVAFGPRVPNSPAATAAGDWITAQMRQRADTVIEQRWDHRTKDGKVLHLRNVLARWKPAATERVLYLTHWDSRPVAESETDPAKRDQPIPGANDGASGVGLFVALGDVLKKTPPSVGVDLLFVDGEDYGTFPSGSNPDSLAHSDVLIGSRWFADHLPSAGYTPLYGVLFDMIGDRDLQIFHEYNSLNAAPEVVARVWNTAAELGYVNWFVPQARYTVTDDHIPLLAKGMHVIDVIDIDYPDHHKLSDTMDKISARSLQIVGDVAYTLVK